MAGPRVARCVLVLLLAPQVRAQELPAAGPADEPATKTTSASEQFVVHGADLRTRGAVASLAEQQRERLAREVGEGEDRWEHPIVIQLHGRARQAAPGRLLRTSAFKVGEGFRLQVDAHLAKGKPPGLERAILELLLMERGLRGRSSARVEDELRISPWLLDGLEEAIRWREGDRDQELYAALFEHGQLFPVERLLAVDDPREMDSAARSAFRASAGALVMALLSQNGGREAMRGLLGEAVVFVGEDHALLLKHFPGMNLGAKSLAKWWALQLARMAETPVTRTLDILGTEAELRRLLVVRHRNAGGEPCEIPAGSFRDLLAIAPDERREAIKPVADTAGLFFIRAFPAHRPLITAYLEILAELAADQDRDLETRLAALAAERERLRQLGARTRDYLDWYRITSSDELSGAFADYIKVKESLQAPRTPRKGTVSSYLDDMQALFECRE